MTICECLLWETNTLFSIILCNHILHDVAIPYLYTHPYANGYRRIALLAHALSERPDYRVFVKTIRIRGLLSGLPIDSDDLIKIDSIDWPLLPNCTVLSVLKSSQSVESRVPFSVYLECTQLMGCIETLDISADFECRFNPAATPSDERKRSAALRTLRLINYNIKARVIVPLWVQCYPWLHTITLSVTGLSALTYGSVGHGHVELPSVRKVTMLSPSRPNDRLALLFPNLVELYCQLPLQFERDDFDIKAPFYHAHTLVMQMTEKRGGLSILDEWTMSNFVDAIKSLSFPALRWLILVVPDAPYLPKLEGLVNDTGLPEVCHGKNVELSIKCGQKCLDEYGFSADSWD